MNNNPNTSVSELTKAIIPYIESKKYSEEYVKRISRVYRKLNQYCENNSITHFTAELGQQFISEVYGVTPNDVRQKCSHIYRAVDMLSDFQQFGTVMLKRRLKRSFPMQFKEDAENYLLYMEKNYARPNTIKSYRNSLFKFTDFLESIGVSSYDDITLEQANSYIKVILCNYSSRVAQLHFRIMSKFLKYLYESQIIEANISDNLIEIKVSHNRIHLPSTLTEGQIEKILSCVDRDSPMGKRDYAVLLVASRLGLRGSDIRNLKPENIDWENHEIHITQVKTNEPLTLPLPDDVGWALIDYIKNARPVSDSPEIFLRVVVPHISLANPDNILVRYMRLANIPYQKLQHHGLHTMRHSLATHMLEQQIPITTIQSVLGHVNLETTMKYISIDSAHLRECALEVPDYE